MKNKFYIIALCMLGLGITATAQDTIVTPAVEVAPTPSIDTNIVANKNIVITDSIKSNDTIAIQDTTIDTIAIPKTTIDTAYIPDTTINTIAIQDTTINNNDTIKLHVVDIITNYGINKEFFTDTNAFESYLLEQPQNFVELRDFCQSMANYTRAMIADLDLDYHNGFVWLDEHNCIADYDSGRVVLQRLSALAEQKKNEYDELEKERIETEKRLAEERAKEEARRKQEAKNQQLAELHQTINQHHQTIENICNSDVENKSKQKTLKDLYYAYLAVYNKYDVTTAIADDRLIHENNNLNDFQQHLIDSLLGEHSYYKQLDNFKERLKENAGREYAFVYKSYIRLFKRIAVAINFSTIEEYTKYVDELQEIRFTQNLYMESVEQLKAIKVMGDTINKTYGKKYRDEVNAYKTMQSNQDFTPTFINTETGEKYIDDLIAFQAIQQRYYNNFKRFEGIEAHGNKIIEKSKKHFSDIANAYNDMLSNTSFVTSFSSAIEADEFDRKLDNFEAVQNQYDQIIYLRIAIARNDDSILHIKSANKNIISSYKNIKKVSNLTPNYISVEQGEAFIKVLKGHMILQDLFLQSLIDNQQIRTNANEIVANAKPYKNINKAYKRIAKNYTIEKKILTKQDLDIAIQIQRQHLALQQSFINALKSADVDAINHQMKQVTDLEKIKLILKVE